MNMKHEAHKSPIVVFIAREHNNSNDEFSQLKENDNIDVKIVGVQKKSHKKRPTKKNNNKRTRKH